VCFSEFKGVAERLGVAYPKPFLLFAIAAWLLLLSSADRILDFNKTSTMAGMFGRALSWVTFHPKKPIDQACVTYEES